jgi:polyphosphate kinase
VMFFLLLEISENMEEKTKPKWWQLPPDKPFYNKGKKYENFVRAKIFEAYPDKQIKPMELYKQMKNANFDVTPEQVSSTFNRLYEELNKKHVHMIRCPNDIERRSDEKFECMQYSESVNYEDLVNRRIIREWDFEFVSSLDKARKDITDNDRIRLNKKKDYLAAIDFWKVYEKQKKK